MSRQNKAKRLIRFIAQKVRGLKNDVKIHELITSLKDRQVFAGCIQETWRCGISNIELNGYHLLTSGLPKDAVRNRRGEQGVSIVLSPEAFNSWKAAGCELHNDLGARVIGARLLVKDNWNNDVGLFLISAYAPIGRAKQYLWDDFMETLEKCIRRKRPGDILLIGCDSNSSSGTSSNHENIDGTKSVGKFGLPYVNHSGIRFRAYMELNHLTLLSTHFKKRTYTTWINPRSKKPHQIDHMICEKSELFRFTNSGTVVPFVDTDHRAVMCNIKLLPRLSIPLSPRQRIIRLDDELLCNCEHSVTFCRKVRENLNDMSNNDMHTNLMSSMRKAAHDTLTKRKRPSPGWFKSNEEKLLLLITERNEALSAKIRRPTRRSIKRLREARRSLKIEISRSKNRWISELNDWFLKPRLILDLGVG